MRDRLRIWLELGLSYDLGLELGLGSRVELWQGSGFG